MTVRGDDRDRANELSAPAAADSLADDPPADMEQGSPPVIFLEAEPPGPDDPETWIEPADPPEENPVVASSPSSSDGEPSGGGAGDPAPSPDSAAPPALEPGSPDETPATIEAACEARPPRPTRHPRLVIAFASGKGGVGKSLIAGSVGVYLAQLGKQVVLVDAALGAATLHTFVGLSGPGRSLQQFINREIRSLAEAVLPTPFPGLGLIAGLNDGTGAANPRPAQKNRLLSQLRTLSTDYVLLDLGSGSGFNVLDMFLVADVHVVVTVPEPTAVEGAFRLLKSAFLRRIRGSEGLESLLESSLVTPHCGIFTPHQINRLAAASDRANLQQAISAAIRGLKPRLVVNQCRAREDLEFGPSLAAVGRWHLGLPVDYLGYVDHDDAVWVSLRRRRPLQVEFPEAKVCKDIDRIARRLLALESQDPMELAVPSPFEELSHYEILGTQPGATEEEIRRAHRRTRRLYDESSNVAYGVAPPDETAAAKKRIGEAYAILVDPDRRRLYDQGLFPEMPGAGESQSAPAFATVALPASTPAAGAAQPASPGAAMDRCRASGAPSVDAATRATPMPSIDEATEFTGDLLRQVREATGIELQEVAERTKISIAYLRAIEQEQFQDMPAAVYLRGFVKAVARCLHLDADRVARSYMARYETRVSGQVT